MKHLRKVLALVLAAFTALVVATPAFAATQTVALDPADADNATITVNNPAKGETYTLHQLFDATTTTDGKISYQGTVPNALSAYFTADNQGYIHPTDAILVDPSDPSKGTKMTDELKAALETWAKTAAVTNEAVSNGSESLQFTGLPYGYYVVTTTHEDEEAAKALITVDSTAPDASIYDKNVNEPSATKDVEHESYSIGDTIKYTLTFDTTNFMGEGENSKQVVDYVIQDTLPEYLSDVTVTSITIGGADATVQQFDSNKKITIEWATKDETTTPATFTSLYNQGAKIVITYTAKLTSVTNINKADKNVVTITPEVDNGSGNKEPWDKSWEDDAEITTYAAAINKVDSDNKPLAGAQFTIAGLTVEKTADGVYTVVSYDPQSTTASAVMDTDSDGKLYIVGLASDVELTVTEYKAPDGYNKLTETKTLKPQVLSKQLYKASGTEYYDADGNLVASQSSSTTSETVEKNLDELDALALEIVNNQGTELPSTGGMGTTILYTLGGILVVGGAIFLIAKNRSAKMGA